MGYFKRCKLRDSKSDPTRGTRLAFDPPAEKCHRHSSTEGLVGKEIDFAVPVKITREKRGCRLKWSGLNRISELPFTAPSAYLGSSFHRLNQGFRKQA